MTNGPAATETRHLRTLFSLGAAGMLTDGQLLERFATLGGDPAELAFAALIERHGPMVLRVARSNLVDDHSAHDAFQATFLILARKARSLWVRDSLGPWLHQVARRVASRSRASEARRRVVEEAAARPESHPPVDEGRSDLLRAIHREIDRLPHPYRLAVVSCHLEGLTQHEAAARLGWPVGTLQSRLARGRQRLRDRLRRQGFAPSLGALVGKSTPVPTAWTASTAKAALTLVSGESAADLIGPAVLGLIATTTKGMLMTKLKLGALALLMACGVVGSGVGLGVGRPVRATDDAIGREQARKPTSNPPVPPEAVLAAKPEPDEPGLAVRSIPRPWETAVRVKFHVDDKILAVCSGTIISSSAEESIILTCGAAMLGEKRKSGESDKEDRVPITVDIFDGRDFGDRAKLDVFWPDVVGEAIDRDLETNLGLIRIRPGRKLPASPVVGTAWQMRKGAKMITVGCSQGRDATVWSTTILNEVQTVSGNDKEIRRGPAKLLCEHRPREGREGGGLFTTEGELAGVCGSDHHDWMEMAVGCYAGAQSIRKLLERNGLAAVYQGENADEPRLAPRREAAPPPEPSPATPAPADRKTETYRPGSSEPSLASPIAPRPWETTVRVQFPSTGQPTRFASGTIIGNRPGGGSLILTVARNFRKDKLEWSREKGMYQGDVWVNLTDGQLRGLNPATAVCLPEGWQATLVAVDFDLDLALIEINAGRSLPVSPIHTGPDPAIGAKLFALGCPDGGNATAWETTVLHSYFTLMGTATRKDMVTIKCTHEPRPGRSGGGLFATDGSLVGVCLFADPIAHVGLYALPESIRKLLDKAGLASLYYRGEEPGNYGVVASPKAEEALPMPVEEPASRPSVEPARPPASSDPKRLDDLERKLNQVLRALEEMKAVPPGQR